MNTHRIGDEIRRRMDQQGLSAKELSLRAGLGATYVRDVITGRSKNPRTDHIRAIAKALNCNPLELFEAKVAEETRLRLGEENSKGKTIQAINSSAAFAELMSGEQRGSHIFAYSMSIMRMWWDRFSSESFTDDQMQFVLNILTTVYGGIQPKLRSRETDIGALLVADLAFTVIRAARSDDEEMAVIQRIVTVLDPTEAKKGERKDEQSDQPPD